MLGVWLARRNRAHPQCFRLFDDHRAVDFFFCEEIMNKKRHLITIVTLLTALSSRGVKTLSSCFLIGTINVRKNGKANEYFDDLTAHKTASAIT